MFVTGELGTYHVKIKGEGKVTLLLECGMMHTLHQWNHLQNELCKFAKVISYDRLGYGKSGVWTSERSSEQQAFECYDVLSALSISSPLLVVAHSLGAYISFQLCHLFPSRVQSLILLDPTHPTLEEQEQKIYDKILYQFALTMKGINQFKILKAIPNRLLNIFMKSDFENDQSEIIDAFKSKKHWKTVVSEWNNLSYSGTRIKEELKKKLQIPLYVLTASKQSGLVLNKKKKDELLHKVEKYHKEYVNTSVQGTHETLLGFTHSSIYGNSKESAEKISKIIVGQIDLLK